MGNYTIKKKYKLDKSIADVRNKIHPRRTVLENGLRIVTEEVPYVESFSLGIALKAGSRNDYAEYSGLSHFIEHLTFRSTKHGSSKALASKFEDLGAYANAYTAKEFTYYHIRALRQHFTRTFKLLTDLVIHSEFKNKDIESERSIILEEIKFYQDDPEEVMFDLGERAVFGNHPLSNPITGSIQSVERIGRENLEQYYKEYYNPSNIIITVAGNIKHEEVVSLASSLEFVSSGVRNEFVFTPPDDKSSGKIFVGKPVQQAYLQFGRRISATNSAEKFPLLILNEIFAEGMSSRLQDKLREKNSLAYSLESDLYFYSDCGALYINAVLDKSNIRRAEDITFTEMNKLREGKIFKSEFTRAKEQLKSSLIMESESMTSRMANMIRAEIYNSTRETLDSIIDEIEGISLDDLGKIAGVYYTEGNWNTTAIIPDKK